MSVGLVDRLRMRTERAFVEWARERSLPTCRVLRYGGELDPARRGASLRFSGDELSGELVLVATPELLSPASGSVRMRPADEMALAVSEVFDRLAASMRSLGVALRADGVRPISPAAVEDPVFDLTFASGGGVVLVAMTARLHAEPDAPRASTTRPRAAVSAKTTRKTSVR